MQIKSIFSKDNLANIIHISIYGINIVVLIILIIFINNNVYKAIIIESNELKEQINEAPKNINSKKFEEIIQKINDKKTKKQLHINNVF